jgi:acetoacetyl-CoA reductase
MARVALVTGGTRGIGGATAIALHMAGYKVAANFVRNADAAQKFSTATGIRIYEWDVASWQGCKAGLAQVEADLGPVEILVNNAGITRDSNLHRMRPEHWSDGMRARNFGRIINISSINGQKGQFGQVNYSAAKAASIGFTKALAQENANSGITVNAICPGCIDTDMVRALPKQVLERSVLPFIPVGRAGEPNEIARCVLFLAADEAGFITGSTVSVNGGHLMV